MITEILSFFFGFVVLLFLFVFIGYIIIDGLTRILFFISEETALTKIYHEVTGREGCEDYYQKILKMAACNFNLSIPIILTFLFIIKNTVGEKFKSNEALIVSLFLSIGTLVSMRLLSNPTKLSFKPKTIKFVKGEEQKISEIKIYQERINSFFFSFISATIIFIMVAFLYTFFNSSQKLSLTDLIAVIMPPATLTFSFGDFILMFICYTVVLLLFTCWGEYILKRNTPLLQMR